jgi:hypothetical protein
MNQEQKDKREEIVKALKKKKSDFVKRYGDEAENVMYATATKQALTEISTEKLAKYKEAAGQSAREADKKGDYELGNKRFRNILKATRKQFDNDKKQTVIVHESAEVLLTENLDVYGKYTLRQGSVVRDMPEGHPSHVVARKNKLSQLSVKADASDESNGYGTTHRISVRNNETGETSHHHIYQSGVSNNRPVFSVRSTGNLDNPKAKEHNQVLMDYLAGKKTDTKVVQEAFAIKDPSGHTIHVSKTEENAREKAKEFSVKTGQEHYILPINEANKHTLMTHLAKQKKIEHEDEEAIEESYKSCVDKNGRTKLSAEAVIKKAREIAAQDIVANPPKARKLTVNREHMDAARKFFLQERIDKPQGIEVGDPISKDSKEGNGRVKKQMGNKAPVEAIVSLLTHKLKKEKL